MDRVLEIEDVKMLNESGRKIARFIFNDDKVVRIDISNGQILTPGTPRTYINLISIFLAQYKAKQSGLKTIVDNDNDGFDDYYDADEEEYSRSVTAKRHDYELQERIDEIKSGRGAGLGVFVGVIVRLTIIGAFVAGLCSMSFLDDISDEEYLRNANVKDINFRKGFYSASYFGLIVAACCCDQWKTDMISVLKGTPTRASENRHTTYKVWFWVFFVLSALDIIGLLAS